MIVLSQDPPPYHMRELSQAEQAELPPDYLPDARTDATSGKDKKLGRRNSYNYAQWTSHGSGLRSSVQITNDGRLALSLDLRKGLPDLPEVGAPVVVEDAVDTEAWAKPPSMQIVIFLVGSRGDIQPYIALGKLLKADGHRVRIATHETFRTFVHEHGLEFFCIGGNPHDLMSYMVKNPGLMPGMESLRNGDIGRKRKMLKEMIYGCWDSCYSPDETTIAQFAADVIISNPPAFAHVHCAEALGIPLQMSFTMPWSSTTSFQHPLVQVSNSNAGKGLTNTLSFALAEILTWQGTGDLINKFRVKTLGLRPLDITTGPAILDRCKVPWTYCMSPGLVPKPLDWSNHIDVTGFYFLDLATTYTPPPDLVKFLAAGAPPIYIGFGSIVIDDREGMTNLIFEATQRAGVRALVSAGWGGLGGMAIPPNVFILGNVPHDWLFSNNRVQAVIHHGGAGTTAAGLAHGRPTAVIPFFGDQEFWGKMIARAGAGPDPIRHKELTVEKLVQAIGVLMSEEVRTAAWTLAENIRAENGVRKGVESLYRHLPLLNMRCDIDESRVAVWWDADRCLKLSAFAAQVLVNAGKLSFSDLDAHRPREYEPRGGEATDPISGGANALFWMVTNYTAGIAEIFQNPAKGIVHTTVAIPKGIMKVFTGLHQGFHNIPRLYGSEVRKKPKIDNFADGVWEGTKGLWFGYADSIVGLVKEPYQGAKNEGWVGFLKGSARSYLNLGVKPAAGILGLMAYPMKGVWKQGQMIGELIFERQVGSQRRHQDARQRIGLDEISRSNKNERLAVLLAFSKLKQPGSVVQRRSTLRKRAERVLGEIGNADDDDTSTLVGPSSHAKYRKGKNVPLDGAADHASYSHGPPPPVPSKDPQLAYLDYTSNLGRTREKQPQLWSDNTSFNTSSHPLSPSPSHSSGGNARVDPFEDDALSYVSSPVSPTRSIDGEDLMSRHDRGIRLVPPSYSSATLPRHTNPPSSSSLRQANHQAAFPSPTMTPGLQDLPLYSPPLPPRSPTISSQHRSSLLASEMFGAEEEEAQYQKNIARAMELSLKDID
ncbi:hypothetical protein DL96DRAFT_1616914 [Flagelloscypha sp. PMI_526]|nr:hypothetical protein DL96DRAFT_1616914 [Flagelloscypha sp. PMI_526]